MRTTYRPTNPTEDSIRHEGVFKLGYSTEIIFVDPNDHIHPFYTAPSHMVMSKWITYTSVLNPTEPASNTGSSWCYRDRDLSR